MALVEALMSKLLRPPSVLVVDDDVNLGYLILNGLHDACECDVDWALDGERAIEHVATRNYDLIFLDLMLPKKNGVEVLRFIKDKKPATPVILVTGYVGSDLWMEATSLGVVSVLSKPFIGVNFKDIFRTYGIRTVSKREAQECAVLSAPAAV